MNCHERHITRHGLGTGLCCILLGYFGVTAAAQVREPIESVAQQIEQLRLAYLDEVSAVRQRAAAVDSQWLDQYGQAVTRLADEARERGDFRAWQTSLREQRRFEADRSLAEENLVAEPAALRAIQQRAIDGRTRVRQRTAESIVEFTTRLVAQLDAMTRERTIQGDADGAERALHAIAQARNAAVYTDALQIVEDAARQQPEVVEPDAPPQPPSTGQSGDPPDTGRARRLNIRTSPDVRVYEPGQNTSVPGAAFRIGQLIPTPAVLQLAAGVTARHRLRSQVSIALPRRRPVTADGVDIQLVVRMLPGVPLRTDLTVVLELFGRRPDGTYVPATYAATTLVMLDHRPVTVEFPTLSHQVLTRRGRDGEDQVWPSHTLDRGLSFGGFMVSVFDSEGDRLFQGASTRELLPFAGDARRYRRDGTLNLPSQEP